MKINEVIVEEMQSTLMETLIKVSSYSEEDAVRCLQELNLDNESATELLSAYKESQVAAKAVKDAWNTILESKVKADHSDIAEYQQKEFDTRKHFDKLKERYALLIIINSIEPSEIDEELLKDINEKGVQENEITNPELKIHFHYYLQIRSIFEKVEKIYSGYKKRNEGLSRRLEESQAQTRELISSNESLQKQYQDRIDSDEKYYQLALAQIEALKKQLEQSQKRGIFRRIFSKKTKEIPDTIPNLPKTLSPEEFGDQSKEMQPSSETIKVKPEEHINEINNGRDEDR